MSSIPQPVPEPEKTVNQFGSAPSPTRSMPLPTRVGLTTKEDLARRLAPPSSDAIAYARYILCHYSKDSYQDYTALALDLERHGWTQKDVSEPKPGETLSLHLPLPEGGTFHARIPRYPSAPRDTGKALLDLKQGRRVARQSWHYGGYLHVTLKYGRPIIAMTNDHGSSPWTPSDGDWFADDWFVIEEILPTPS